MCMCLFDCLPSTPLFLHTHTLHTLTHTLQLLRLCSDGLHLQHGSLASAHAHSPSLPPLTLSCPLASSSQVLLSLAGQQQDVFGWQRVLWLCAHRRPICAKIVLVQ